MAGSGSKGGRRREQKILLIATRTPFRPIRTSKCFFRENTEGQFRRSCQLRRKRDKYRQVKLGDTRSCWTGEPGEGSPARNLQLNESHGGGNS